MLTAFFNSITKPLASGRQSSQRTLSLETLESRQFLAADITVSLKSGLLRIEGTKHADEVSLTLTSRGIQVGTEFSYSSGGLGETSSSISYFKPADVKRIWIFTQDGDDTVTIDNRITTYALAEIFGGNGHDTLSGGGGPDHLYGGAGKDILKGNSGNDSLHGGVGSWQDQVTGGAGKDRFLTDTADLLKDGNGVNSRAGEDAEIRLANSNSSWTDKEVEVVNQAFQQLFDATGNNRLLKDSMFDSRLTVTKAELDDVNGDNTDPYQRNDTWYTGTWPFLVEHTDKRSVERVIRIDEWDETGDKTTGVNARVVNTVIHEFGHNWDSGGERSAAGLSSKGWSNFTSISDWRSSNPAGKTHYVSGDGDYYYSKASADGFFGHLAETDGGKTLKYGKFSPREDFATSFAEWMKLKKTGGAFGTTGGLVGINPYAQAKLDNVGDLVRGLKS